jgi:hypothetical protein
MDKQTGDIVRKKGTKQGKPYLVTNVYKSKYQHTITIECLKTGRTSVKDADSYKLIRTHQSIVSMRNNVFTNNKSRKAYKN